MNITKDKEQPYVKVRNFLKISYNREWIQRG